MTTKPTWRLLIAIDGASRKALSVVETKKGDLVIHLRPNPTYHRVNEQGPLAPEDAGHHGERVIEQRYSVHPSHDSITTINALKQTIRFKKSPKIETRHYTKTIKSQRGFAPIFIRIGGKHQDKDTKEQSIPGEVLCNISSSSTIVFCIFVGHKERLFDESAVQQDDFSVFQKATAGYRIIALWSLLAMRPIGTNLMTHFLTSDDKTLPARVQEEILLLTEGLTEQEVVAFFKSKRDELRSIYLREVVEKEFRERGLYNEKVAKMLHDFGVWPYFKTDPWWLPKIL